MFKAVILIIISFFAVIGIIECLISILEKISVYTLFKPNDVSLRISLSGNIENISFILTSLLLQVEKSSFFNGHIKVIIIDNGLSHNTYMFVKKFCETNRNFYIEKEDEL